MTAISKRLDALEIRQPERAPAPTNRELLAALAAAGVEAGLSEDWYIEHLAAAWRRPATFVAAELERRAELTY